MCTSTYIFTDCIYLVYTGEKEGIDCVVYVCYLLPKMLLLVVSIRGEGVALKIIY